MEQIKKIGMLFRKKVFFMEEDIQLFRVLDALAQRGKLYCCKAQKGE